MSPAPASPTTAEPTTRGRVRAPGGDRATPAPEADVPTLPLRLGRFTREVALEGEHVERRGNTLRVNLTALGLAVPGVRFTRLDLAGPRDAPSSGTLHGDVQAPFVSGSVSLQVDGTGTVTGGTELTARIGLLDDPRVTFRYEEGELSGSLELEASELSDRLPIPGIRVEEGRAIVTFRGSQLSGSLQCRFLHPTLGSGGVRVSFSGEGSGEGAGQIEGAGDFVLDFPLLAGSSGSLEVQDGALAADLTLVAAEVRPPVPALDIRQLEGSLALRDGRISGTAELAAAYAGLGELSLEGIAFGQRGLAGATGTLRLTPPFLEGAEGTVRLSRDGRLSGNVGVAFSNLSIPALRSGRIRATLREDGGVDVTGTGTLSIGRMGSGDVEVGWEDGVLSVHSDLLIEVPRLDPVRGRFAVVGSEVEGEASTGVAVGPLAGSILLGYRDRAFWGEGRLDYELGRFSGWVLLRVDPEGAISGEGEGTVRLADWLTGTVGLAVDPELNVDARGVLVFPSSVEVFPRWEMERSFFRFSQEFPLWGITIPVVGSIGIIAEINASAGFRAGFGPGVLRNITAEGELSTRPEVEPAFSISGDFHIPAGAEVVLTVGGGIGLAALVASITGGIDLRGIAGVYGALTLTPTFAYRDGEYRLRGEALVEAAAQLRAEISAYARIVAGVGWLRGEVWREDWRLAEWRFDTGWALGLRASMDYVLGQPFRPEIEFDEVDVDPLAIVRGAVPQSGQPVPAANREPDPQASFRPAEGEAGAPVAEGEAPRPNAAGEGAPQSSTEAPGGGERSSGPAEGGAAGGGPSEGAGGSASADDGSAGPPPRLETPPALRRPPEERAIEEAWLVYLYRELSALLPRREAPFPRDEGEARRAIAAAGGEPPTLLPDLDARPGTPLPSSLRARLEAAFAADLSGVRVHTDEEARRSARRVGAEGYTVGEDIVLAEPHGPSTADPELLAHEVAHVVQGSARGDTHGILPPDSPLEEEAEEAAAAVRVGAEPPALSSGRGEPGLRRAQSDTGTSAGGSRPRVALTPEAWTRIRDELVAEGSELGRRVRELLDIDAVRERAAGEFLDDQGRFSPRPHVPMRYPGPGHLSHRNVFGTSGIRTGDFLIRHDGRENDGAQSLLREIMYHRDRQEEIRNMDASPATFTRSPSGTYDRGARWEAYRRSRYEGSNGPDVIDGFFDRANAPRTQTYDARLLSLSEAGFDAMWTRGWVWFPGARRGAGIWRRRGVSAPPEEEGATEEVGPDQSDASPPEIARLRNDFEAHHVIPLWLRSGSGRTDGDRLENLVPWKREAHQTNHRYHEVVPDEVRELTGVRDFKQFQKGTRFLIHEADGGNIPHGDAPPLRLERDEVQGANSPAGWSWKHRPQGAPWLP